MPPATSIRTTRPWSWLASANRASDRIDQGRLQAAQGHPSMFTQVIAQRLGLESDLTLALSVLEGLGLTVVLMLLVERHVFSAAVLSQRPPGAAQPPPTPQ